MSTKVCDITEEEFLAELASGEPTEIRRRRLLTVSESQRIRKQVSAAVMDVLMSLAMTAETDEKGDK